MGRACYAGLKLLSITACVPRLTRSAEPPGGFTEFFWRQLVQPRGSASFGLPPNDLAGMVVGNPPHPVFADKEVARGEGAALELLLAEHQRYIAIKECVLIKTSDARRVGVREDPGPALDDRVAVLERGPSRVTSCHRRPSSP